MRSGQETWRTRRDFPGGLRVTGKWTVWRPLATIQAMTADYRRQARLFHKRFGQDGPRMTPDQSILSLLWCPFSLEITCFGCQDAPIEPGRDWSHEKRRLQDRRSFVHTLLLFIMFTVHFAVTSGHGDEQMNILNVLYMSYHLEI